MSIVTKSPGVNYESEFIEKEERNAKSGGQSEDDFSAVQAGATSVSFVLKGKRTVKSGKRKHRISIASYNLNAHFRYTTAPKLKPYVYLKANTKNTSPYPLLPGESTIYLDNSYIAKSRIPMVATGQRFWTFFGADTGITVKYNTMEPTIEKKGVFKKKEILVYKRSITIEYHKKTQHELVVWDHVPMPKEDSIKINLIKPDMKNEATAPFSTEERILEWKFDPKPGEKIEIPIEFTVQYPKDKFLEGHKDN